MIEFKDKEELTKVLENFDVQKLSYKDRKDAGPDEELYFFTDKDGNEYGLWSRDYMSELKYEAIGLKNDFNINVKEWIATLSGDDMAYYDGYCFALFKI